MFVPIGIEEYIQRHVRSNADEKHEALRARLRECVSAALRGKRCQCGEPIWVIGSAAAGHACFTCITDEATASNDYQIDEALAASAP